jgi:SSS family solute:Na+ symporter
MTLQMFLALILCTFLSVSSVRPAWGQDVPGKESEDIVFSWQPEGVVFSLQNEDKIETFVGIDSFTALVCVGSGATGKSQWKILSATDENLGQWQERLIPLTVQHASAAKWEGAVLIIGGIEDGRYSDAVRLLRWDRQNDTAEVKAIASLPNGLADAAAVVWKDVLYVAGGKNSANTTVQKFWSLDLKETDKLYSWRELEDLPCAALLSPVIVAQNDSIYIWSTHDSAKDEEFQVQPYYQQGWRYQRNKGWKQIAALPVKTSHLTGVAFGQALILFTGVTQDSTRDNDLLAYHTIIDAWSDLGEAGNREMPFGIWEHDNKIFLLTMSSRTSKDDYSVLQGELTKYEPHFSVVDYAALGGYLATMMLVGAYFSKREKSTNDYFLGGRRVPWWVAGISIRATTISSIGFMAIPAKIFMTDMTYFWGLIGTPLSCLVVAYFFIPFYRRLKVTTAYEYLEQRFNVVARWFGSIAFILFQTGRISVVMYLPAVALSAVTGINLYVCVVVAGVLCTIYTVMGGIEAVVWTDLLQAIVLFGGAICIFVVALTSTQGGIAGFWDIGMRAGKFHSANLTWDITVSALWVIIVGEFFMKLVTYSSDQAVVQRYLTTKDEKTAIRSIWMNVAFAIPWWTLVFFLGAVLFTFYQTRPELLDPRLKADSIVPLFVAQRLPIGVAGLVIAGLFAATMSTVDSGMHSVATAVVRDFYCRLRPASSDRTNLLLARLVTALLGVFATLMALWMAGSEIRSIWDFFMKMLGLLTAGLGGLFALGVFTKRANGIGSLIGMVISALILYWVSTQTRIHLFLYAAVGFLSCYIIGYLISLAIPYRQKDLAGLTIYDMGSREDDV